MRDFLNRVKLCIGVSLLSLTWYKVIYTIHGCMVYGYIICILINDSSNYDNMDYLVKNFSSFIIFNRSIPYLYSIPSTFILKLTNTRVWFSSWQQNINYFCLLRIVDVRSDFLYRILFRQKEQENVTKFRTWNRGPFTYVERKSVKWLISFLSTSV